MESRRPRRATRSSLPSHPSALLGAVLLAALTAACSGQIGMPQGMDDGPDDPRTPDLPPEDPTRPGLVRECDDAFEAVPPRVYAAKVKSLLTSMPLTAEELASVNADPESFSTLVETWVDSPESEDKLRRFFGTALQQDGFDSQGLADLLGMDRINMGRFEDGTDAGELFQQSFRESFARLVMEIVRERRSFDEILTSQEGYFTTAQLLAMAYRDDLLHTDEDEETYRVAGDLIEELVYQGHTPTTLAQTLNPSSPEWMRFYVTPDQVDLGPCAGNEFRRPDARNLPKHVMHSLFGFYTDDNGNCTPAGRRLGVPMLSFADFTEYRKITFREPDPGEETTKWWDLDALRNDSEMVFSIPKVGFFTAPGFFATWPTNDSNQARVTTNQTLIVALGESFDGEDSIVPAFDDALDGEHASPGTACYGCHVNLDPMRQYFRNSFSYYYHEQTDASVRDTRAAFGFHGVTAEGEDVFDLAEILGDHPRFATAMVQKACYFATSAACPEESEEFEGVVERFVDSGLDYRSMLVDLLTSPLVTGDTCVPAGGGDLASNARRRHLCATLSRRLDYPNACGDEVGGVTNNVRRYLSQLVEVIPDDAYSRGAEEPVLITDTNMFLTGAAEAICGRLAREVTGMDTRLSSADPDAAIEVMLTDLMGLVEGDPRREPARGILRRHFDAAAEEKSDDVALQSTFVVACVSPGVTALGL